jgi:hypothetical protein
MGDDTSTGFKVRNVRSRLFTNGCRSGLLYGAWLVHLPLTNQTVKIGVSDFAGSAVIFRKMDIGFRVHEPEND